MSPILLLAWLTACGGTKTVTVTETQTVTTTVTETQPAGTTSLRVYFLRYGKVAPVGREVSATKAVGGAALGLLAAGPTPAEAKDLGLTSALPASSAGDLAFDLRDGILRLSSPASYTREALAQIVYTATQFPTVRAVDVSGKRYTRPDFEDLTPSILVESPLPFETVASPLRAKGTANTFEATFEYDLADPDGTIVAHHFVTATSGSGTRGTFDFTVPFTAGRSGPGRLIVYERSAADGKRIHIVEIPVRLG